MIRRNGIMNTLVFTTHYLTDSNRTVIRTFLAAEAVKTIVGVLLIYVGAYLSIMGVPAPTKVCKLTPNA